MRRKPSWSMRSTCAWCGVECTGGFRAVHTHEHDCPAPHRQFAAAKRGPVWRWAFWADGWYDYREPHGSFTYYEPTAEGTAASRGECEAIAVAYGVRNGGWLSARWLTSLCQYRAGCKRMARGERGGQGPAVDEYLFEPWDDYDGARRWSEYLIVKKTARYVYVETHNGRVSREAIAAGKRAVDAWDYSEPTVRLDRRKLETEGHAYGRRYGTYYTEQGRAQYEAKRAARPAPRHLAALGLDRSATVHDVKRAYRRLAKHAHPDRGGDAVRFREITAHYEAALCEVATA